MGGSVSIREYHGANSSEILLTWFGVPR
jgi:hypothetical protein